MLSEKLFPFTAAPKKTVVPALREPDNKTFLKVFKVRAMGLGFNHGLSAYYLDDKRRASFEEAPYNFDKIIQAIDTDSYLQQGFSKYSELLWKEGWEVTSENIEAVDYLWQRIDLFELTMGISWNEFLVQVADQLVKFSNVFIAIARGNIRPYISSKLYTPEGVDPISGYYILPTEKIRVLRDKHNRVLAYRQELDETSAKATEEPIWDAKDVIHLRMYQKPTRPFGTPFIISSLDDVVALRQIEEDAQNLVHRELSPIYKYKVGTEDRPASKEEIEDAAQELENMRVEGGLILPERHDVEVIGSEGSALDITEYLAHFKERVAVGLGLSPHHLGMTMGMANKAASDRLDISLYDRVKLYQRYLENAIRLKIFNPLLFEGGFDPMTNPTDKESRSDRCLFKFREIDRDTQIKIQTHALNLFVQNAITWEELRMLIGYDPEGNVEDLFMSMQHKLDMQLQTETAKLNAELNPPAPPQKSETITKSKSPTGGSSTSRKITQPVKPDAQKPSTGLRSNPQNVKKGLGNVMKPSNQFGRRLSPNVRHSDDDLNALEWLDDLVNLIEDKKEGDI